MKQRNRDKFYLILKLSETVFKIATAKTVAMAGVLLKTRSDLIVFRWDKETSLLSLFTLAPEIKDFCSPK